MLKSPVLLRATLIVIIGLLAAWFVSSQFQQTAYLPDDGAYGYVAQRILAGDVLNGDIQDIHAGYINFVNAGAMAIFGESLLAMRIPLVAITVLQCCLVFWILARQSLVSALVGAALFATMTFVQFLNPTANWYSLFGAVVVILILSQTRQRSLKVTLLLGLTLGAVLMIRQLSGFVLGVGVLCYLLYESRSQAPADRRSYLPLSAILPLTILAIYAFKSTRLPEFAMIAIWPLLLGYYSIWQSRMSDTQFLRLIGGLGIGVLAAIMPLLIYHIAHGTTAGWWHDTVHVALTLPRMPFVDGYAYSEYFALAVEGMAKFAWPSVANGLFWVALIVAPMVLGILLLRLLRQNEGRGIPAIAFIASFYSLVSIHYQIPVYLFYSSALTLTAIAAIASRNRTETALVTTGMIAMCAVAVTFHAGQSIRHLGDIIAGQGGPASEDCNIKRLGVDIPRSDCMTYRYLLEKIETHATPADTVLALPVNPEINFLSGVRSPLRFFNSALGLRGDADVENALILLKKAPPVLVYYSPHDKYVTGQMLQVMQWVKTEYRLLEEYDGHHIYYLADR